jgi:hypothetical protein
MFGAQGLFGQTNQPQEQPQDFGVQQAQGKDQDNHDFNFEVKPEDEIPLVDDEKKEKSSSSSSSLVVDTGGGGFRSNITFDAIKAEQFGNKPMDEDDDYNDQPEEFAAENEEESGQVVIQKPSPPDFMFDFRRGNFDDKRVRFYAVEIDEEEEKKQDQKMEEEEEEEDEEYEGKEGGVEPRPPEEITL